MLKKILLIVLILAAIAGGALYYFGFFEKQTPKIISPAIDAIPANAAFIIEWKNFDSFKSIEHSENKLIQSLKTSGLLNEEFSGFNFIDSVLLHDTTINEAFIHQPLFISAHLSGVKKFNFLFTTNLPVEIDSSHLERFFNERFKNSKLIKRPYEGSTVYELKKDDISVFSYTIINSVFLGSRSTVLTEEGLRHLLHGTSLREDVNFKKVMETSKGRENGTAYINYKVFPSFTELFLTPSLQKEFNLISHFANWTAADIKIKDDAALLTGYVFSNDTNNNYLNIFKEQKPQQIRFHDILPATVSYCHWTGLENVKGYFRAYQSWLENGNRYFNFQNDIKALNDKFKVKFPDDLHAFCGKEFFNFSVERHASDTIGTGKYFAFEVTDSEKALSYFKKIRPTEKEDTLVVTKNEISIIPVHLGNVMDLTGLLPYKVECNYLAQVGDYFVFAPVREDLLSLAGMLGTGNAFRKSPVYKDINEYLPNEASIFIFTTPYRSRKNLHEVIVARENENLAPTSKFMSDYSVMAMQITRGKELFYHDVLVKYNPEAAKELIPAWEAESEEEFVYVQAVTQNKEHGVFAVDALNNLNYYDDEGNLKFSRKLPSVIQSKILALPVKSETPVYIIPCKTGILAVNINGIDQSGYPIKTKVKEVAVIDYENKNDPRIIIGTSDKKVQCFNSKGDLIPGFTVDIKDTLANAPLYARAGNKDHLIFITNSKIVFTDRKGKTLFEKEVTGLRSNSARVIRKGNSAYLAYLSENGKLNKINIDKKESTVLEGITDAIDFSYEDFDKNRKRVFLVADTNKLQLVNDTGMVIRVITELNGLLSIETVKTENQHYISYKTSEELGIIDPSGYPVAGVPVKATGLSISESGTPVSYFVIRGRKIYKFVTSGN